MPDSRPSRRRFRPALTAKIFLLLVMLVGTLFAGLSETVEACGLAGAQSVDRQAARETAHMASTVMREWPAGVISTTRNPGGWGYEEGVLLDGMAAEWRMTKDPAELAYIKTAVDRYVRPDGSIQMNAAGRPFPSGEHQLDNIEMGRPILFLYRQTSEPRYRKAAEFLHAQLAQQPRNASGGYWHKQIYPNQMWLDGAYMAEPFRAEYAATFHLPGEFEDIAHQFLLMNEHMRDPKTGLLRHGWDESRQMPWADNKTGLSPEVWARAMGWYSMALVDVLDWMPKDQPQRTELVKVLGNILQAVEHYQSQDDHLWWQVMDHAPVHYGMVDNDPRLHDPKAWAFLHARETAWSKGNFPETSASAMFVYALAKAARKGYLAPNDIPQAREDASKGWQAIQKTFVTTGVDGFVTLTGTVKAAGLGGTPYRSGTYAYYVGEPTGDNDAKGVGAYLMAGAEVQQVR